MRRGAISAPRSRMRCSRPSACLSISAPSSAEGTSLLLPATRTVGRPRPPRRLRAPPPPRRPRRPHRRPPPSPTRTWNNCWHRRTRPTPTPRPPSRTATSAPTRPRSTRPTTWPPRPRRSRSTPPPRRRRRQQPRRPPTRESSTVGARTGEPVGEGSELLVEGDLVAGHFVGDPCLSLGELVESLLVVVGRERLELGPE